MNLKAALSQLESSIEPSPWSGHEHVRGYGVFGLPLSSGHILALRVFPVNDFAPYITIWHQTPDGSWSIHYDAPRPDICCPRYYGAAAKNILPAKIKLDWRSANELHVSMENPKLEWTIWPSASLFLRIMNAFSKPMPLWTWKKPSLLRPREFMARMMGVGQIDLAGITPSGHYGILMPQQMFMINKSNAVLDGVDLGSPTKVYPNPKIGDTPMPARGIFAIGQGHWEIRDIEEYNNTRKAVANSKIYK